MDIAFSEPVGDEEMTKVIRELREQNSNAARDPSNGYRYSLELEESIDEE